MIDKEEIKFSNKLVLWVFGGFFAIALLAILLENALMPHKVFLPPLT